MRGEESGRVGIPNRHSRCAHRLRNDTVFTRGAVQGWRADRGVRPYAPFTDKTS